MPLRIRIKRVYEAPEPADGRRILIDRLWARGLSREKARVDLWLKEIAPSNELRRWYQHDPRKWAEFQARYAAELDANPGPVRELLAEARAGVVTLLFSSREEKLNNAHALKGYIEAAAGSAPS